MTPGTYRGTPAIYSDDWNYGIDGYNAGNRKTNQQYRQNYGTVHVRKIPRVYYIVSHEPEKVVALLSEYGVRITDTTDFSRIAQTVHRIASTSNEFAEKFMELHPDIPILCELHKKKMIAEGKLNSDGSEIKPESGSPVKQKPLVSEKTSYFLIGAGVVVVSTVFIMSLVNNLKAK